MVYQELDIEAALNGAPIVIFWEEEYIEKGYLHKSKAHEHSYIFESENSGMMHRLVSFKCVRMWVEPVNTFKYWDLLDEGIVAIEQKHLGTWVARSSSGIGIDISFLKKSAFPDCPVWTVIHRPEFALHLDMTANISTIGAGQ